MIQRLGQIARKHLGKVVALGMLTAITAGELSFSRDFLEVPEGQETARYIAFTKDDFIKFRNAEPNIIFVDYVGSIEDGFGYAVQAAPIRGVGVIKIPKGSAWEQRAREKFNSLLSAYNQRNSE